MINIYDKSIIYRGNGFLADVYAMSPVMSTYQVCVVVGIFGSVEAEWQGVTSHPVLYISLLFSSNVQFELFYLPHTQ